MKAKRLKGQGFLFTVTELFFFHEVFLFMSVSLKIVDGPY